MSVHIKTAAFAKELGKNLREDPEKIRHNLRLKCRKSLYFLAKAVLQYQDLTPDFHLRMCRFAQDTTIRRRLGEHPRGHL